MQPKQILSLFALVSASAAAPQGTVVAKSVTAFNCSSIEPAVMSASASLEAIRSNTDGATNEQLGYIIQSYWDGYGAMMWACQSVQEIANANATQA